MTEVKCLLLLNDPVFVQGLKYKDPCNKVGFV